MPYKTDGVRHMYTLVSPSLARKESMLGFSPWKSVSPRMSDPCTQLTWAPPYRWVGIARQDCEYEPEPTIAASMTLTLLTYQTYQLCDVMMCTISLQRGDVRSRTGRS